MISMRFANQIEKWRKAKRLGFCKIIMLDEGTKPLEDLDFIQNFRKHIPSIITLLFLDALDIRLVVHILCQHNE